MFRLSSPAQELNAVSDINADDYFFGELSELDDALYSITDRLTKVCLPGDSVGSITSQPQKSSVNNDRYISSRDGGLSSLFFLIPDNLTNATPQHHAIKVDLISRTEPLQAKQKVEIETDKDENKFPQQNGSGHTVSEERYVNPKKRKFSSLYLFPLVKNGIVEGRQACCSS